MSMLSAQCDELRERAKTLRQGRWSDGADDARLMEDAADIIEGLESENAKLRELVRDFDKCLTEAVRLAYIQGHATIYDSTLLDSLHPRMRELGIEEPK